MDCKDCRFRVDKPATDPQTTPDKWPVVSFCVLLPDLLWRGCEHGLPKGEFWKK